MVFVDDKAAAINALIEAVEAIEEELGITPSGVYADVRVRLDILEARINNPFAPAPNVENPFIIGNDGVTISVGSGVPTENRLPGSLYLREDGYNNEGLYSRRTDGYWHLVDTDPFTAGGDLSGTIYSQKVIGLQNRPISPAAPQVDTAGDGYVLSWNNISAWWEPQIGFFPSGDLSGNKLSQTVSNLQNTSLVIGTMNSTKDGYSLIWNNSSTQWQPQRLAIVFDPLNSSTSTNLRSNRYSTQSPIDNTKTGIVNLSSDTSNSSIGAIGDYSTIVGGNENQISSDFSSIFGGAQNTIGVNADYSSILSGSGSVISGGIRSIIASGNGSGIGGSLSAIIVGTSHNISGDNSFIAAGLSNIISTTYSSIINGTEHEIHSDQSIILSGNTNYIGGNGTNGIIGSGLENEINLLNTSDGYLTILNGKSLFLSGSYNTILNGDNSSIQSGSKYSTILSGSGNNLDGYCNVILNGNSNTVSNTASRIWLGGNQNTIDTDTAIINGFNNSVANNSSYVFSLGYNNNISTNTNHTAMRGHDNQILSSSNFAGIFGQSSNITGSYSHIFGSTNTIYGDNAFVLGSNNYIGNGTTPKSISIVLGNQGKALYGNQLVQSSRAINNVIGSSQFTRIILDGYQISGGQFNLTLGQTTNNLTLEDNKSYDICIRILVTNTSGSPTCARFIYDILAHQVSGTLTLDNVNNTLFNDNGTGWTITVTTTAGNQLVVQVDSSGILNRRAIATVEWREISRT